MYLKALISAAMALIFFCQAQCLADFHDNQPALSNPARAAGKVLVVLVYDHQCKIWCSHVRPIIQKLAEEYGERVHVEEVDSSASTASITLKQVKALGILPLYKELESVPVLLICDINRKQCKEITGPKNRQVYKAAIDKVLAKGQ